MQKNLYAAITAKSVNATLHRASVQERAEVKLRVADLKARRQWVTAANVIHEYKQRGTLTVDEAAEMMRGVCIEERATKN